jgi:membrane-associated phospholipid phosphatase
MFDELSITYTLQSYASLVPFMRVITFLGQEEFYILFIPAIYFLVSRKLGMRMLMLLLFTFGLNAFLKLVIHSPRPYWVDPRVQAYATELTYGMPSGHAQVVASFAVLLASQYRRSWVVGLGVLIAFLVGVSRVFLGVHFVSDVLVGWLLGVIVGATFIVFAPRAEAWLLRSRLNAALGIGTAIVFAIVSVGLLAQATLTPTTVSQSWGQFNAEARRISDLVTIAGLLAGSVIAYGKVRQAIFIDEKPDLVSSTPRVSYLPLPPHSTPRTRWLRFAVALIGGVVLWLGLRAIFPRDPEWLGIVLRLIRYALVVMWMLWLTPKWVK